jgi:hypothetical protein
MFSGVARPRVGQLRIWKTGSFAAGKIFLVLDVKMAGYSSSYFDPCDYLLLQEGEILHFSGLVRDHSVLLEKWVDCPVQSNHGEEKA